jgi:hypothetical protein
MIFKLLNTKRVQAGYFQFCTDLYAQCKLLSRLPAGRQAHSIGLSAWLAGRDRKVISLQY